MSNRLSSSTPSTGIDAQRMPTLVSRVVQSLLPTALNREIELVFVYPDNLPPVWADDSAIQSILQSLLQRALKSTPPGGRINGFIGVEPEQDPTRTEGIRVTIIDSGEPDAKLELWGSVEVDADLPLSKSLIDVLGGQLWVEQLPGEGSCYLFTLPGPPKPTAA